MKWIVGLLIVCSSLFSDVIAIAGDGETLASNISSKASRCTHYIFIDENGKVLEIVQNPHKDIKGGASSRLVEMLSSKKVSHFIASNFGDKLIKSLDSNSIKYTTYKGTINDFIQEMMNVKR